MPGKGAGAVRAPRKLAFRQALGDHRAFALHAGLLVVARAVGPAALDKNAGIRVAGEKQAESFIYR